MLAPTLSGLSGLPTLPTLGLGQSMGPSMGQSTMNYNISNANNNNNNNSHTSYDGFEYGSSSVPIDIDIGGDHDDYYGDSRGGYQSNVDMFGRRRI